LTTREVSGLLGVSTGTVQKMADQKVLESFLTTGGHRRIAAASVQRYMEKLDPGFSLLPKEGPQHVQGAFDSGDREFVFLVSPQRAQAHADPLGLHKATFVSRPSQLFKLFCHRGVVVIDAAITWVDWLEGLRDLCKAQDKSQGACAPEVLVFNAQLIDRDRMALVPDGVALFEEDLTLDFVRGYFALQSRLAEAGSFASMN
jgi:excisionase family DNA binding protein